MEAGEICYNYVHPKGQKRLYSRIFIRTAFEPTSTSAMSKPPTPYRSPVPPTESPEFQNAKAKAGAGVRYPNPPDPTIPDPATLRDQWRFAIRQYSRWYSQAWGTAILAGGAFFALGWLIKGSNPLPSSRSKDSAADDGQRAPSEAGTE